MIKIKYPLYILFVLAPFYPMLSSFLGGYSELMSLLFSGTKDILLIVIVSLALINLKKPILKKSLYDFLLLMLLFISITHLIGVVDVTVSFNGMRYLVYYIALSFVLMLLIRQKTLSISFDTLQNILSVQFITLSLLGLWEYFDPSIVEVFYNIDSRLDLKYAKYVNENRIVGSLSNPIIYGSFLCLGLASFNFVINRQPSFIKRIFFYTMMLLGLFVVIFTYSRLALITYILIAVIIVFVNSLNRDYISIFFVAGSIFVGFPFLIATLMANTWLYDRVTALLAIATYTGNPRVDNWLVALNEFDNFIYYFWGLGVGASFPDSEVKIENGYFTMFAELGVIGGVAFIIFITNIFYKVIASINCQNHKLFYTLFFIVFLLMNIGNDFVKVFPFSLYFWFFASFFLLSTKGYGHKVIK